MTGSKSALANVTNNEAIGLLRSGPGMGPCAVFLKDKRDFSILGPTKRKNSHGNGTGIWCIGNCLKKSKSTASIRLLDQSEEDVAVEDVQMLSQLPVKDQHCSDREIRLECKALTVIENPKDLELGDLVYGEFQHGNDVEFTTETTKVFFRGRVAALDPPNRKCNICYDDGDYEVSVPYDHVIRVTINEHKAAWIDGISISVSLPSISLKNRRTGTSAKSATISVDSNNNVRLHCSAKNEEWKKKITLVAALQYLFNEAKHKIGEKRLWQWPQAVLPRKRLSPVAEEKQGLPKKKAREPSVSTQKSKPTSRRRPSLTAQTPSITKQVATNDCTTPLARPSRRSNRVSVQKSDNKHNLDEDGDTTMVDDDFPGDGIVVATSTPVQRTRRSTARKVARKPLVTRSDVPAVPEESVPPKPYEPLPDYPVTLLEMNQIETSTISKVLLDDPVAAQELLSMHLVVEGKVSPCFRFQTLRWTPGKKPSEDLWKTLLQLVLYGPRYDEIYFPDPCRMEIATDYILSLFRIKGLLHDCTNCLSDLFYGNETYGDVFLSQMAEGYYMATDDLERETSTERIRNTVHAKSCSARVFLEIIKFLFHDYVVKSEEPPCKVLFQQAPRECFKQAILVAKSIWKVAPRDRGIAFRELTESWGTILSYLAWWYGQFANEDADALADLLSDISHSVPPNFLFDVIDTLKPEIIPQVRPKLAERWNLSEEYNLCYSI